MAKKLFIYTIISLFVVHLLYAQSAMDRMQNINSDWLYLESNESNPENALTLENWNAINLPYTWNRFDVTDNDPGYRRGAGWYRKVLNEKISTDNRYILYFEGSNITTDLYVNNKKVGSHLGGYVGFEFDITDFLVSDKNVILVRVNNDQNREIIPSSKSDFFIYGGITRDVWLKTVPSKAYIEKIKITTPLVSKNKSTANFDITLGGSSISDYSLKLTVYGPNNEAVYSENVDISKKTETFDLNLNAPLLWHVKDPSLYTVEAQIMDKDKVLDALRERYGYRWFEFKEHGAFYLNGERLKLRGTHRHEEHAGYGAAMPNEIHRSDIQMIKDIGANMIRLAHYPQDPEVYKACDELGIIVWDELPWCRGGLGNEAWKNNTKRLLVEMINQNYNHPSIVFWSLGNEIYWLPDFENGDDREKINAFLKDLNDVAHDLDPHRLTSLRKYYEGADIPDVFSPSIWAGWYSGKYRDYEGAVKGALKKYKRFLHAEYGGSSHVGRHSSLGIKLNNKIDSSDGSEAIVQVDQINYAQDGDWSENYIVDLMDWHLKISETTPEFAGNLQWAFKDFGTPLRPENDIPYINQKGLVDREGKPKDAYYVFKSYWSEDPFTYIESSTWTERYGDGIETEEISVYSNCPSVELYLNGVSQGSKDKNIDKFPASGLSWNVSFKKGSNQLISIGQANGEKVYDTLNITYYHEPPGSPVKLELDYKKQDNGAIILTATAVDKNGRRCTNYQKKVYFQSLVGGKLKHSYGTPTGSNVIGMANGQASIEFIPEKGKDKSKVMVLNQDFKGTYLDIPLSSDLVLNQP